MNNEQKRPDKSPLISRIEVVMIVIMLLVLTAFSMHMRAQGCVKVADKSVPTHPFISNSNTKWVCPHDL
jgi:hypothetical protein